MRPLIFAVLPAATPAVSQDVLSDGTGNWAAPEKNGFCYRAVLTAEGDRLWLRIFQGMAPDAIGSEPQFDNPAIAYRSPAPGGRDWLEVTETGALEMKAVAVVDGYIHSERTTIRMMDFQFTVMDYAACNNALKSAPPPDDVWQCFAEACYACEADVWTGTAVAGGEPQDVPEMDFEARNASCWTPERVFELGF